MADERDFDLVLLKVDPNSHPLYFVIKAYRPKEPLESGHDEYFFNEHTCPTNWTDDIVAVISRGDEDPHGFAEFVKRVRAPKGVDEDGDFTSESEQDSWRQVFPEIEVE